MIAHDRVLKRRDAGPSEINHSGAGWRNEENSALLMLEVSSTAARSRKCLSHGWIVEKIRPNLQGFVHQLLRFLITPRFVQDESAVIHGEGIVGPETQHAGEGVLSLPASAGRISSNPRLKSAS